jgi:hypothetical protein
VEEERGGGPIYADVRAGWAEQVRFRQQCDQYDRWKRNLVPFAFSLNESEDFGFELAGANALEVGRVQIVAHRSARRHFPLAPGLRRRPHDHFLVDIESQIEFFFYWCVCWFDLLVKLQPRKRSGLVRLCSPSTRRSSPRKI